MRDIQLYAKDVSGAYQRIELFGGDAITVTDSIKNAKDPAKVFTTFSQQFVVPASKANNKVFKHYYNHNIENTFDARRKTDAYIEIDNLPFKTGKLSLDGVDMRNNSPYAYRVTFYGKVVNLKDIFREDKLPSLSALDIDKPFNASAVLSALTSADASDGTHIPLITVGQSLYYNSGTDSEQSGNLHYNASVNQGVKHDQLKYAVSLVKVIEAIESKYSLTFASDSFFKAADKFVFNQLYLWCHRKKGEDTVEAGDPIQVTFADGLSNFSFYTDDNKLYVDSPYFTDIEIDLIPSTDGNKYNVVVHKNGSVLTRLDNRTGTTSINVTEDAEFEDYFEVFVETYENDVTFSVLQWDVSYREDSDPASPIVSDTLSANKLTYDYSFLFNIAANLPDMKIIDFVSGLFKMFNLVAYYEGDQIQVKPLDEFYTTNELDISKYVDIEKSQVNVALPYKEITFKYKDSDTLLAQQHYQEIATVDANGRGPFEWGAVEYTDTDPETLSGGSYKVEAPFHHMKFERIIDDYDGTDTNVQWGYFVDDNEETYLGSPLLFYSAIYNPGTLLSFLTPTGTQTFGTAIVRTPSNYRILSETTSDQLHFNPEINEFTRVAGEETLFKQFYQSYIENIFNKTTRLTRVSCMFPAGILIQINLSDVILLNGQKYRINSYTANLKTGKTDLELINYYA